MPTSASAFCELLLNLTRTEQLPASYNYTDGLDEVSLRTRDRHALLYIVVVLLFYSLGIVIGIITYLKREKREIEEEKLYESYMNFRNDPDKLSRLFGVQRMVLHINNVEAEVERRREREREEEAKKTKRSFMANLRRLSSGDKKRFSLIEGSLFSSRRHSAAKEDCDTVETGKRRWSLKPSSKINTDITKSVKPCSLPSPKEEIELEDEESTSFNVQLMSPMALQSGSLSSSAPHMTDL
jgi:hypothetical protein